MLSAYSWNFRSKQRPPQFLVDARAAPACDPFCRGEMFERVPSIAARRDEHQQPVAKLLDGR